MEGFRTLGKGLCFGIELDGAVAERGGAQETLGTQLMRQRVEFLERGRTLARECR